MSDRRVECSWGTKILLRWSKASYFTARTKQLHAALEFAEKQIKSGKHWDTDCEKIISEALLPRGLPKGFTLCEP